MKNKIKTENMRGKNWDATIIARNTQFDMLYGENEMNVDVNGMNTAMWLILKWFLASFCLVCRL